MLKFFSWITVILWMLLIFYLSQQPVATSNELSSGITERIIETVEIVAPQDNLSVDSIHHTIRKNAHFFIYFFLGIFVLIALKRRVMKGYRKERIALYICVAYAVSDEVHQLFVSGRGAQVKDVLIDSAGAAMGILLASLIDSFVKSRARSKRLASKETV